MLDAPLRSFVRFALIGLIAFCQPVLAWGQTGTAPDEGVRFSPPTSVWITGATITIAPGRVLDAGNLVIEDGKITAVGDVPAPPGAETIDLTGKHLYPAFVDPHAEFDAAATEFKAGHWNENIIPQRRMHAVGTLDAAKLEAFRKAGIAIVLAAPTDGLIKGHSTVVLTGNETLEKSILRPVAFQHMQLYPSRRARGYPNSPMGVVALARQTLSDADWYARAQQAAKATPALAPPDTNLALEELQAVIRGEQTLIIDGANELYALRADRLAREFSAKLVVRGSGREYRRLDAIKETQRTFIVPVNFPDAPKVASRAEALDTTLQELMHWRLAPDNPGILEKAGVRFVLTADRLAKTSDLLPNVRTAIERGLSENAALHALTLGPAQLLEIDSVAGTLEVGKLANLIVANGPLFDKSTKIQETWVAGKRNTWESTEKTDLRGQWQLALTTAPDIDLVLELSGTPEKLKGKVGPAAAFAKEAKDDETKEESKDEAKPEADSGTDSESKEEPKAEAGEASTEQQTAPDEPAEKAEKAEKVKPAKPKSVELKGLAFNGYQLSGTFEVGEVVEGQQGAAILGVAVLPIGDELELLGHLQMPDGQDLDLVATRIADETASDKKPNDKADDTTDDAADDEADDAADDEADDESSDEAANRIALALRAYYTSGHPHPHPHPAWSDESTSTADTKKSDKKSTDGKTASKKPVDCPINFPLGAYGVTEPPAQAEWILVRGATIWTCGEQGVLENADMLVHQGIISEIGMGLQAPEGATIIDASGMHVSPGIIDCHSHMATDGGVNESGQAITAEVRIADFIDPNDITIYRHLAGGVTTANILHGSANPIGGQNQVIKLRWGSSDEEMKMTEAPGGIKFALGENVKQSSRTESTRYPQTRMGVEQIMRDRFEAAIKYRAEWQSWSKSPKGLPPRRDYELDAIAEILEKTRWVHCHSYKADEILGMLRTLEDYGITIGSLQHILEGYKVADAMAAHGATGSSFSDWWAYKFEVYDAIPHNGALMHKAGVVVSFNSDDAELARHLNHEAAKAVKYGGVDPHEALKFVTLNPAIQLRIDQYIGSLEPGKHADFVIWNRSPLSTLSVCTQTWVDGRKYFDREQDMARRAADAQLHRDLVQSIISSGAKTRGGRPDDDPSLWWVRYDEFCGHAHDHEDDREREQRLHNHAGDHDHQHN
jgi:imidazolonepropionase-like amidohydrolase